jgi:glycosyltransferase involved in cell wall biosynthesis
MQVEAGTFASDQLHKKAISHPNWKYVDFFGQVSSEKRTEILTNSKVGLILLHPTKTYIHALPVKLFEYMKMGLPSIASDFEILNTYYNQSNIGYQENSADIDSIRNRIHSIIDDGLGKGISANAIQQISSYTWEVEFAGVKILIDDLCAE